MKSWKMSVNDFITCSQNTLQMQNVFSSDECFQMHSVLILIEVQGLKVERLLSLNCFEELFNNGITIGQDNCTQRITSIFHLKIP